MHLQLFEILEDTLLGITTIWTGGHILPLSSCNMEGHKRLGLHSLFLSYIICTNRYNKGWILLPYFRLKVTCCHPFQNWFVRTNYRKRIEVLKWIPWVRANLLTRIRECHSVCYSAICNLSTYDLSFLHTYVLLGSFL